MICVVAGIHGRVTMSHQGAPLDLRRIKQNATIVVSLGGLKGGKGEADEVPAVPYATIVSEEHDDRFAINEDMTF